MNTRLDTNSGSPSSEARGRPLADSVLELIWTQQEVSRAEIARRTGLSRSTVSDIVSGLLQTGLVAEVGDGMDGVIVRGGKRTIVDADAGNVEYVGGAESGRLRHLGGEFDKFGQSWTERSR